MTTPIVRMSKEQASTKNGVKKGQTLVCRKVGQDPECRKDMPQKIMS